MARKSRAAEVAALVTLVVDAVEASQDGPFSREKCEEAMEPMMSGLVDWIRAREDDDLEVDLSGVAVNGAQLEGTGSIT